MRITAVECMPVFIPVAEKLRWGKETVDEKGSLLIKVSTDEGIIGYGEAGWASSDYPQVVPVVRNMLAPIIIGQDPFNIAMLWEKMHQTTHIWGRRGYVTYALSGVDIALWDIIGKACNMPLYKLFGAYKNRVRAYSAPSLKPADIVARECEEAVKKGFTAIKLRGGLGLEEDVKIVCTARRVVGDKVDLMIDLNMCYDLRGTLQFVKRTEEYNLYWLEEPVLARSNDEYIREYSRLREAVSIRLSGGEGMFTRFEYGSLISRQILDVVQPDSVAVGGLSEARKIADTASVFGLEYAPHVSCSAYAGLNLAANLHLVGATANSKIIEFDAYDSPIRYDLFVEPIKAKDGYVEIPDRPGLGLEINEEAVAKYLKRV